MMIESLMAMIRYLSPRQDDDAVDRLHYLYTPNILLAFAVLISFKQFGGHPLECMFPNKFPGSWEQYAENYCWAQDTYYVQPDVHVASIREDERYTPERQLSYYKWVPFFLLLEAALFRLPSVFWKYLSMSSGIRIHEVVEKAMDPGNMEESNKGRNIETLTRHMQNALKFHRRILKRHIEVHKTFKFLNIRYSAFFISLMYLVTKALYLINVILQLYILNKFLRTDKYQWYGIGVIQDILSGSEWGSSGYFPRVSLCDFTVRQVGNIQRYSVQCVLVINMFNEKIFVLLWFWFMILTILTIFSFLYWFILLTFPCFSRWFISHSLELSEMKFDPDTRAKEVDRFVSSYLHHDGIFVLRMVTIHAGVIFGTDLVLSLWNAFYGIEEKLSEGRTSKEDRMENQSNFLRQRKRSKELVIDMDSFTALLPTSADNNSPKTPSDD
uniref:Innexin n=1 Tax=Ascaris suum TaxID=6253 RepID=F1L583_ASCSU